DAEARADGRSGGGWVDHTGSGATGEELLQLPGEVGEPVLADDQCRALEAVSFDTKLLDGCRVLLRGRGQLLETVDDRRGSALGLRGQHAEELGAPHPREFYSIRPHSGSLVTSRRPSGPRPGAPGR